MSLGQFRYVRTMRSPVLIFFKSLWNMLQAVHDLFRDVPDRQEKWRDFYPAENVMRIYKENYPSVTDPVRETQAAGRFARMHDGTGDTALDKTAGPEQDLFDHLLHVIVGGVVKSDESALDHVVIEQIEVLLGLLVRMFPVYPEDLYRLLPAGRGIFRQVHDRPDHVRHTRPRHVLFEGPQGRDASAQLRYVRVGILMGIDGVHRPISPQPRARGQVRGGLTFPRTYLHDRSFAGGLHGRPEQKPALAQSEPAPNVPGDGIDLFELFGKLPHGSNINSQSSLLQQRLDPGEDPFRIRLRRQRPVDLERRCAGALQGSPEEIPAVDLGSVELPHAQLAHLMHELPARGRVSQNPLDRRSHGRFHPDERRRALPNEQDLAQGFPESRPFPQVGSGDDEPVHRTVIEDIDIRGDPADEKFSDPAPGEHRQGVVNSGQATRERRRQEAQESCERPQGLPVPKSISEGQKISSEPAEF